MMFEEIIGKHKTEIDTPALLLDMGAVERNIKKMADFFSDKPCKLRPHIKTHKLPLIAHKQIEAGAIGITCAKLGEAKIFLEAGIKDVLIANEIVGAVIRRASGSYARPSRSRPTGCWSATRRRGRTSPTGPRSRSCRRCSPAVRRRGCTESS